MLTSSGSSGSGGGGGGDKEYLLSMNWVAVHGWKARRW